jgi:Flp pilus assembly protein TadD
VALVAFVAFAGTLDNGFVNWDDFHNYVGNRAYQGLGWANLCWAWTTFWMGVYQPLSWMLAELEYLATGLNPRGYHLTNLLLHTACSVVLYALVLALLDRCNIRARSDPSFRRDQVVSAGLATAVFAVHPLRVEPVAWASGQAYLPCALFAMVSILCYLQANSGTESNGTCRRELWLTVSISLFLASLLSKAASLSLPIVLVILDVYPLRRFTILSWPGTKPGDWRPWVEKIPYVALSLIFAVIATSATRFDHTLFDVNETGGIMGRLALGSYSAWFYLVKTLWPTNLHAFPLRPQPLDWTQPLFVLGLLGVILVSLYLYKKRTQWPGLLAAWTAYLVILTPVSGLVTYGRQLTGDRYSYLAMMPWVVLAAGSSLLWIRAPDLSTSRRQLRQASMLVLGLAWVTSLMGLTWRQCQTWENSRTLWTHAINHGGKEDADLHNNLGVGWAEVGDFDSAVCELKQAVRLNPDRQEWFVNLANAQSQKGDLDGALKTLRVASLRWPDQVRIRGLFGKLLFQQGRYEDAASEYQAVVRLQPEAWSAHLYLAYVLAQGGWYTAAANQYAEALRLSPDDAEAQRGWSKLRRLLKPPDHAKSSKPSEGG